MGGRWTRGRICGDMPRLVGAAGLPRSRGEGPAPRLGPRLRVRGAAQGVRAGAYADLALRAEARELDARDRALAMRLAYGAVQRRGTLDYLIERLAERPVEQAGRAAAGGVAAGAVRAAVPRGRPRPRGGGGRGRAREGRPRGPRPGQRGAAPRHARGRGAAGGARRRHAGGRGAQALPPAVDRRLWWEELGAEDARALLAFDNEPAELALRVNTLVAEPATSRRSCGPKRGC